MRLRKLLFVVLLFSTPFLSYAQNAKYDSLRVLIDGLKTQLNGTLLIAFGDSVWFQEANGYLKLYDNPKGYESMTTAERVRLRNQPANLMQTNTFFEMASISKQFTAAAILKLISQEKLALTDSLRKFFPKIPYKSVTIHQLLSHTSGIPEYMDFPEEYYDTTRLLTNLDVINVLIKQNPKPLFAPKTRFKYINTNYVILAAIVAQVSGQSFEEYVRQNIFLPAGMRQTFFVTEKDSRQNKSIASGHLKNKEEIPPHFMDGTLGDKGVYTNMLELYKWTKAYFIDYKIIPKKWVDLASQKKNYISGKGKAAELYGYGLRLEDNELYGSLIYHGGLWHGNHHIWLYRPSDKLIVICLSNFRNRAHVGLTTKILQIIDGK
ncbi:MAG: beta-lactamase family protein [Bacteroidales bacterium]|jgi:CubicO group peptidase (beta-lactamase class C family)|nr:beta-lactamase family protein [Bacteroidales bacterium]